MKKFFVFLVFVFVIILSLSIASCTNNPLSEPGGAKPAYPYSELVSVPGGTFTQTDETGTNSFSHTISAFKMGKYEVTYDLWYMVKTWALSNGYSFANAGMEGYDGVRLSGAAPTAAKYQPVTTVSWRDVIVWCNAYSEKSGFTPCYTYASAVIKDSTNGLACDAAVCDWTQTGYRLPSEGEWQYAASYKDGSSWQPYNYASGATADYTDAAATGLVAWYTTNSGSVTHDDGGKNANMLGIYDMSGNVLEWCWDRDKTYPGTSTNYRGPSTGSSRVIRGGYFDCGVSPLQVGYRYYYFPSGPYRAIGFRLARST